MKSKFRTHPAGVTMRIGGQIVNLVDAKYLYHCAECLGELDYWNAGLACKSDKNHRLFVRRRDVAAIQAARDIEVSDISANYEIIDGLLKPKGELLCQLKV